MLCASVERERGRGSQHPSHQLSNRTQHVQIDDVFFIRFANIMCDVPRGSVLGP